MGEAPFERFKEAYDVHLGGSLVANGGATGACTALRTVGESCTDTLDYADCTYAGNGSPASFCSQAGDAGVCAADLSQGTACVFNAQCLSGVCDYVTSECQPSTPFDDPLDCTAFQGSD